MDLSETTRKVRSQSIGWLIQRLARRLEAQMGRLLAELGLVLPQFATLMTVLEHDGLSQTDIGNYFGAPPWAISRALDGLEAAGLVERRDSDVSRRAFSIHVTSKGRELAPRLFAQIAAMNESLLAPLSVAERKDLIAMLARLVAHAG